MGPETGSRTLDKLDFILFLLVLLLRVSLRILALVRHLLWLYHRFYIYFFHQALFCGVHHKVLPTISFMSYLGIKFIMFLLYWMHSITSFLLCFPFKLCQGLLFWPQLFYCLTILPLTLISYFGQWITIVSIMRVYMVPLCCGAAYLAYLGLSHLPTKACPRRRKRHHCRRTVLAMTNKTLQGLSTVTFDTDGIPFIVNKSATCIITNER